MKTLQQIIDKSKRIVFFGGAGVSTASGIPDFRSADCGGVVKPSVVLYGEPLDHYVSTGACREISRCDCLIVAGTSLSVEPAASMLEYFCGGSRELVIINREETGADSRATLVVRGDIAEIMDGIRVE